MRKWAKTVKQAGERRTHHVVELSVAAGDDGALHIVDRINELVRDGQNLSIRPVDYAKALAPHSSQSRLHLLTDFDVLIRTLGLLAGYVCYVLKSRRVLDVGLDLPNNTAECAKVKSCANSNLPDLCSHLSTYSKNKTIVYGSIDLPTFHKMNLRQTIANELWLFTCYGLCKKLTAGTVHSGTNLLIGVAPCTMSSHRLLFAKRQLTQCWLFTDGSERRKQCCTPFKH